MLNAKYGIAGGAALAFTGAAAFLFSHNNGDPSLVNDGQAWPPGGFEDMNSATNHRLGLSVQVYNPDPYDISQYTAQSPEEDMILAQFMEATHFNARMPNIEPVFEGTIHEFMGRYNFDTSYIDEHLPQFRNVKVVEYNTLGVRTPDGYPAKAFIQPNHMYDPVSGELISVNPVIYIGTAGKSELDILATILHELAHIEEVNPENGGHTERHVQLTSRFLQEYAQHNGILEPLSTRCERDIEDSIGIRCHGSYPDFRHMRRSDLRM
mgnify:CR=1 FL=1|tara:strand:- start:1176 stop:1973 length:798 start_codon:yes stop_codon:yes gene_type:complete